MSPIVPDLDIWFRALTRHDPDPVVVHRLASLIEARRIFLTGPIRQALLSAARDERAFTRLARALVPFADLRIDADLRQDAARLALRCRGDGRRPTARACLLWAAAARAGGLIWSQLPGWSAYAALGCPLTRTGGT